jgi:hypothetical protein
MTLNQYITTQLRELGLKRGDLPSLLGYTNPNKCLKRIDRLCKGDYNQPDLLQRISESRLGGRPFEVVMKKQVEVWEMERQEKQRMKELKDRLSFVPHLLFIHERSVPSPIHIVNFIGVEFFKKLEIPDYILNIKDELKQLNVMDEFIKEYLINPYPDHRLTNGPFGKVVQILYRVEYEHSYVFDVQKGLFVDCWLGVPQMGIGRLTLKGGGVLR